jgi:hypothetical protein
VKTLLAVGEFFVSQSYDDHGHNYQTGVEHEKILQNSGHSGGIGSSDCDGGRSPDTVDGPLGCDK